MTAISRRLALTGLIAAMVSPSISIARAQLGGAPSLRRIETYLNQITTLEARFTQYSPDGTLAKGSLFLSRPAQLRMDYDPPSKILLIAPGDWRLVFYDGSIQQASTIPIGQTPLGVLLDENVQLGDSIEVVQMDHFAGELGVTLRRRNAPDQGSVTLVFAEQPLDLRRWTVIDSQGLATTVVLEQQRYGEPLDAELFRWRNPRIFGYPDDD